jgi:hypothetical protein
MEGTLRPEKAALVMDQAVLSDASSRHEQHVDAAREGQRSSHASDQSSSTANEAPATATVKAGDDSDTDMSEVESHSGATAEAFRGGCLVMELGIHHIAKERSLRRTTTMRPLKTVKISAAWIHCRALHLVSHPRARQSTTILLMDGELSAGRRL